MASCRVLTKEQARILSSFVKPWQSRDECCAEAVERRIREQGEQADEPVKGTWPWALKRLRAGGKVRRKSWSSAQHIWAQGDIIMWRWSEKSEPANFSLSGFDADDWDDWEEYE